MVPVSSKSRAQPVQDPAPTCKFSGDAATTFATLVRSFHPRMTDAQNFVKDMRAEFLQSLTDALDKAAFPIGRLAPERGRLGARAARQWIAEPLNTLRGLLNMVRWPVDVGIRRVSRQESRSNQNKQSRARN
jgi:hypothetical protein